MRSAIRFVSFSSVALVTLVACTYVPTASSGPQPADYEASLLKLTPAVVGQLRFSHYTQPVTDEQLLADTLSSNPILRTAFKDVQLKTRHNAKNVLVLVCSPDGQYAWLEDASWTKGSIDRKYLSPPWPNAEFTLPLPDENTSAAHSLGRP